MDALGRRGHGGHNNKASEGHLGSCRSGLGRYGRGNFPGHDVFCVLPKTLRIECRWLRIGLDGCNRVCGHVQEQKQGKKSNKWTNRACFAMHARSDKTQEVDSDGHGDHRGLRRVIEGE